MASSGSSKLKEGLACMKQPSLIKQLKSVLDQYPKGQILKEIIQNAEDAGAREVKVLYEKQQCNKSEDLAKLENPSHAKALQGPGLCVFNDALFTEKDWEGIQMIQSSMKEKDRLKVGRYGLGFKSVFHFTDWLCIVSGEWILFVNPHQPKDEVCLMRKLENLDDHTLEALINVFGGTFDFSQSFLNSGFYNGTLFWFPLRLVKSDLSQNVYTEENITNIFENFISEAEMILLFLKSLEKISLFRRAGSLSNAETIYTVNIATHYLNRVRRERKLFQMEIEHVSGKIAPKAFHSTYRFSVETVKFSSGHPTLCNSHDWMVVNFYMGEPVSQTLRNLCSDTDLSYSPYVGVAYPLTDEYLMKGHIFCFLPLPLSAGNNTGLPVHVNGFFALTQDRREVKWSQDEEKQDEWNHCLISEALPEAYINLIKELRKLSKERNNSSEDVDLFYRSFPDDSTITAHWKDFLKSFYKKLFKTKAFFSEVDGGKWLLMKDIILALNEQPSVEASVFNTVTKTYLDYGKNVVKLPDHIVKKIVSCVSKVSPEGLCNLLKTSDRYIRYSDEEKQHLLTYALLSSSSSYTCLEGLTLLPVVDGSFQTFAKQNIFFCPQKSHLFPSLEGLLIRPTIDHLCYFANMADNGYNKIIKVTAEIFPEMVRLCFRNNKLHDSKYLEKSSPTLGEKWLKELWILAQELGVDMMSYMQDIPLVPEYTHDKIMLHPLKDNFIAATFVGFEHLSEEICQCLQKLGVVVLPSVPDYIQSVLLVGSTIPYPTPQGVIKTLCQVSKENIQNFNDTAEEFMKNKFREFLSLCTDISSSGKSTLSVLKIFKTSEERYISIEELAEIAPTQIIPVSYPSEYLHGLSASSRKLAEHLGAKEVSIHQLICRVLDVMTFPNQKYYTTENIQTFMRFLCENSHDYLNNVETSQKASDMHFLPSCTKGELKRAKDLFDPRSPFLQKFFYGEDMFPSEEFCQPNMLSGLEKLGLKKDQNVTSKEICNSVSLIENIFEPEMVREKAEAILMSLAKCDISEHQLSKIKSSRWMPVLTERPSSYPQHLPFAGGNERNIGRPKDMCHFTYLNLVGSVKAVTKDNLLMNRTDLTQNPCVDVVVKHASNITETYCAEEHQMYMTQLNDVYHYFSENTLSTKIQIKLATMSVVWISEDVGFVKAENVWLKHQSSDIDLKPYRYILPKYLQSFSDMFHQLGASEKQSSLMLMDILKEIQKKHDESVDGLSVSTDLSLVLGILKVLKEDETTDKKDLLLPVHNYEERLVVKQMRHCVYCESGQFSYIDDETENTYFAQIPSDLARDLGIRILTNPLLNATEEIDMNYGQSEPLTRRLRNLLHEYTDGFSVPKEIIQNADDAGATEVNFLYDERENLEARTGLINEEMASLQGPALWAKNDAQFSKSDFANITKLSGGTKMDDSTKIGRFGLGFNSVYNLTDVPSFVSGNHFVIFDPHQTFLGSAGLKADLTKKKNKLMLQKMKNQFKPYEKVFGCNLLQSEYPGTLFRFPLRTELQAQRSDISGLYYSPAEMKKFMDLFVSSAGNLLLFCQNVKYVRMFHLSPERSDPSKATLLVEVRKEVKKRSTELSTSVLKYLSEVWENETESKDLVNEIITISLSVFDAAKNVFSVISSKSQVNWIISWCLGRRESVDIARRRELKGLLPLAATAISICDRENVILPLNECPDGFYKNGHLFCFLPLPITVPFPLHINGAFALTHDRKHLCSKSEDEKNVSKEANWNEALISDAVSMSVINAFEALKSVGNTDGEHFYALWPTSGKQYETLFKRFHQMIVYNNPQILLYNSKWVTFEKMLLLDPQIRFKEGTGLIAFAALEHYYRGNKTVIDLPEHILNGFIEAGLYTEIKRHTLSIEEFYLQIFFPNINDPCWNDQDRDSLVIIALKSNSPQIKNMIRETPCIPTLSSGTLRQPKDLVHPQGKTACMFFNSDGFFPSNSNEIDFCTPDILSALSDLGMQNEELQWSVLYDRVKSVETLSKVNMKDSVTRCKYILLYLGEYESHQSHISSKKRFWTCPPTFKEKIQNSKFLPILKKPQNWPTSWCYTDKVLDSPLSLYFEECINIGCSNKLILDSSRLNRIRIKQTLEWLGVKTESDISVENIIEHLLTLSSVETDSLEEAGFHKLSDVCSSVYYCLNEKCSLEDSEVNKLISKSLQGKIVIFQENTFISSEQISFSQHIELKPYLYPMSYSLLKYHLFLKVIGVKETFEPDSAANVMFQIAQKCGRNALTKTDLYNYSRAATILVQLMKSDEIGCASKKFTSLFLPDKRKVLQPCSELCLDDCEWLSKRNTMKFLHLCMSVEVAKAFGIKSKRHQDMKSHSIPFVQAFGQHEELTNRIKRILEGYPCDVSLMNELLQNADDAGASELMFIKDFRTHPSQRIFDDRWKLLQGPALCVYNNSYFTQKDLDGIQELGLGSKSLDYTKTGQYGVGFNAVYHLTDVPTFLTFGPGMEETLCVLDPNCLYTPTSEPGVPGARFTNISELRSSYSDVFSCFLENEVPLHPQGTLFRFPLRNKEMAENSNIFKKEIDRKEIEILLFNFTLHMSQSLMFLNNIRKISVASIEESGHIHIENVVEASTQDDEKHRMYLNNIVDEVKKARNQNRGLKELKQEQVAVRMNIKNGHKPEEEKWLIIHQFGFSYNVELPPEIDNAWERKYINLLPRGGVAVRLDEENVQCNKRAFCILPLPIETGLPVHINGHFALDHEARRNLWHGTQDYRARWNQHMVETLIVPAYINALNLMQMTFHENGTENIDMNIKQYNALFPDTNMAKDDFWKSLVTAFYKTVFLERLTLFPVVKRLKTSKQVTWVSVFNDHGFPGYFNNLEAFYDHKDNKPDYLQIQTTSRNFAFTRFSGSSVRTVFSQKETDQKRKNISSTKALKLAEVLKTLGMKIIEGPLWIFKNFVSAGFGVQVQCVKPENVVTFLKSCNTEGMIDTCLIGKLPEKVENTPFVDKATVKLVIKFCMRDDNIEIDGLPLCLNNGNELSIFSRENRIILTMFTDLIKGSPDRCLHKDIVSLFSKCKESLVLKSMDISDLSLLLKDTVDEAVFKQGKAVDWNSTNHPTSEWIGRLWTFLSIQLQTEFSENQLSISSFGEIMEWSLLPVTVIQKNVDQTKIIHQDQLHPIGKAGNVINLLDETNYKLKEALEILGLSFYNWSPFHPDTHVVEFAGSIAADPKHPLSVLQALSNHHYKQNPAAEVGCTLLDYFCNKLRLLTSNKEWSIKMLNKLPFFVTVLSTTKPLINCDPVFVINGYPKIPADGLEIWSHETCKTIFNSEHSLKVLYKFMNITVHSTSGFYSNLILPSFQILPRKARALHLRYIKENLLKRGFGLNLNSDEEMLAHALRNLPFIERLDGTFCRACEFYSNKVDVFCVMCPDYAFPPAPYNDEEWHDFLVFAGMKNKVTVENVVKFALEIQTMSSEGITDIIVHMSKTLTEHLFRRPNLLEENLVFKIRNIKFVLPFRVKHHTHGEILINIHSQAENASKLISFNGSVSSENCYLVWTSCYICPKVPYNFNNILSQLGVKLTPDKESVISHLQNISCSLKKMNESEMKNIKMCLEEIMESIYEFLQNSISEQDKNSLASYSVIYLNDIGRMVKARDIVIELAEQDAVPGYIFQFPNHFGKYRSLFEKLGASKIVSANHYADVLRQKHLEIGDGKLHPNDWKVVQKAVEMLFRCLSEKRYSKELSDTPIFLPSSLETLILSNKLVFSDNPALETRVVSLDFTYFIGFDKLEIKVFNITDMINKLPEQHRLVNLSSLVQDHVTFECQRKAFCGPNASAYLDQINSPSFVTGAIRLIYHQQSLTDKPLEENTVKSVEFKFSNMTILEVNDLQTNLIYANEPVQGSERERKCFIEFSPETNDQVTMYIDEQTCQNKKEICFKIAEKLDFMVGGLIGRKIIYLLEMLQMEVEDICSHLDEKRIKSFNFTQQHKSVFPPSGTIIPEEFHCMLENNLENLDKNEYVGLEIHDPAITEACAAEYLENESTEAVYIYAIVKSIAEEGVSPCFSKYEVEVEPGRTEEINATRLYKFCREEIKVDQDIVATDVQPSTPDLCDILKEIRKILKESWRNLDTNDRKRVVKRLYLKWHPDKNPPERQAICTKVCQYIQDCVAKLDSGEDLNDVTDGTFSWEPPFHQSSFFANMDRRSRSQRDCYHNYQQQSRNSSFSTYSDFGFHSATRQNAYPHKPEARRWLRQANIDLEMANKALSNPEYDAFNWICFKSHQAAEKALKAMLYNQDARKADKVRTHNLHSIIFHLQSDIWENLLDPVNRLENLVSSYNRMRYPDRLAYPQIPSDVYSKETAKSIYDLASDIVNFVKRHE